MVPMNTTPPVIPILGHFFIQTEIFQITSNTFLPCLSVSSLRFRWPNHLNLLLLTISATPVIPKRSLNSYFYHAESLHTSIWSSSSPFSPTSSYPLHSLARLHYHKLVHSAHSICISSPLASRMHLWIVESVPAHEIYPKHNLLKNK
jgi:hypothetical protein